MENWSPVDPMPRAVLPPPMGQPLLPGVPNWAWHEYGMRVGFWRFLDVLRARGLKASFAVNGTACTLYEEACRAALEAGWEFISHGYVQRPIHRVEDQRLAIRDTIEAIRRFTGKPPRVGKAPASPKPPTRWTTCRRPASNMCATSAWTTSPSCCGRRRP